MTDEYFIRSAEAETARGPYDIDKLITLAEAGQVSVETLYYDDDLEAWVALGSNSELREKIFPKRKTLKLRKKEDSQVESLNAADDAREGADISVGKMLAAAEGTTEETRYVRTKAQWQNRAAALSAPALAILLLASATSLIYPSWQTVSGFFSDEPESFTVLLQQPLLLLGAFDLIMGGLMLLAATDFYPILRFRAMLGAGFFGVLYLADYAHGDANGIYLAASTALFGVGIFVCTLTLHFRLMMLAIASAAIGVAGFFIYGNLLPLLFDV